MSKEYIALETRKLTKEDGYLYAKNGEDAQNQAQAAFARHGVNIADLDVYTFDAYYANPTEVVVVFVAGQNVSTSERGGSIEVRLRQATDGTNTSTCQRAIVDIEHYLTTSGAIQISANVFDTSNILKY